MKSIGRKLCLFGLFGFSWMMQGQQSKANSDQFEVFKTDQEWKQQLSGMQYYVLRRGGTEYAYSSALNKETRSGVYKCAGCQTPLFSSKDKYDSGSGWPSFDRPINDQVISYSKDFDLGIVRTEEKCATCGGHLGHVFEDGPSQTTGLRHCINGAALIFEPNQ